MVVICSNFMIGLYEMLWNRIKVWNILEMLCLDLLDTRVDLKVSDSRGSLELKQST